MIATQALQAPFPYFGSKHSIAAKVWDLLGDVSHYVEPFAGSAAVLLRRPAGHTKKIETINDSDGYIVNIWRAIQQAPEEVAKYAAPLNAEVEMHARQAYLQEHKGNLLERLGGAPDYYDARLAGWWLFVAGTSIGMPIKPGGPWHRYQGRLVDRTHTGHDPAGCAQGIAKSIPAYSRAGMGVTALTRTRTHETKRDSLAHIMQALSDRLEHVRITNGDWLRVMKPSILLASQPAESVGVFLDPPYTRGHDLYATTQNTEHGSISEAVREWCATSPHIENGLRVVLCGYGAEHDELLEHGWSKTEGKAGGSGYQRDKTRAGREEMLWISPAITETNGKGATSWVSRHAAA